MTFEFYQQLKASYNYEDPINAAYAMRELGTYIASGKADKKECNETIDSLILASASGSTNIRWGASDGFQEIFMADAINGAVLIDNFMECSDVFNHLNGIQKKSLASVLEESTNEYLGTRREKPNPKLDGFSGQLFEVSFGNTDKRRHINLK